MTSFNLTPAILASGSGEHGIRYQDTKRHRTRLLKPLADDVNGWFLGSGRPTGSSPVFPSHDGKSRNLDDWRKLAPSCLAGRA